MSTPAGARRALLTGGTGFIGRRLAESLRSGGWDVHVVARPDSAADQISKLRKSGCVVHRQDGSLEAMKEVAARANPDCTWHLAARFIAHHAGDDVIPLVQANVAFGAVLLEALAAIPSRRLVTIGSHWQQHGNAEYAPVSLYAATKQAFEDLATFYAQGYGFVVIACRVADTYGPDDPRKKLVWQLVEAARTGTALGLSGDGSQLMDLLHVDDAVRALRIAGDRALAGAPGLLERWAVRTGQPLSVRDLVERIDRVRGAAVPVQWGVRPVRPREMHEPWTVGDVLPGWAPVVSLDEGLASL